MPTKISDEAFISAWKQSGSASELARTLGMNERSVYSRRRSIEEKLGISLNSELVRGGKPKVMIPDNKQRATMELDNGVIVIGSDAHFQPNSISDAFRAFVKCIEILKPAAVVLNGDVSEMGGNLSRHPLRNTNPMPSLKDELYTIRDRICEVNAAAGNAYKHFLWGNHDNRLAMKIANVSPEFDGLVSLLDWMPGWNSSVSLMVNDSLMILHKWLGSTHASYLNTVRGGMSCATGHSHKINVRPYTDWRGTRYGIETGSLANFSDPCFEYVEQTPADWQNGFVVLTFVDGELIYPEICHVRRGKAYFRGKNLLDNNNE